MSAGVRAFVALELQDEARQRIAAAVFGAQSAWPGLRRTGTAGWHLTLRFLGASPPERLETLTPELRAAAARCPPQEARVTGLGLLPERGAPRILWLGVELAEPARALQRACEQAACLSGFAPEPRPFRPHVTLGRFRERAARPRLAALSLAALRLERLVLFESRLDARGAVYTPLHVFDLGAESQEPR